MIQVYYGYGKGKTTCSIGAGMRAKGAGMDVLFVQFLKDNKSSELKCLPFEIFKAPDSLSFNPDNSYRKWIDRALCCIQNSDADMIILDEFLDIIDKFITADSAVKLIKNKNSEVIITGHREVQEIFDMADYITRFDKIRHPFDKGAKARLGIEY